MDKPETGDLVLLRLPSDDSTIWTHGRVLGFSDDGADIDVKLHESLTVDDVGGVPGLSVRLDTYFNDKRVGDMVKKDGVDAATRIPGLNRQLQNLMRDPSKVDELLRVYDASEATGMDWTLYLKDPSDKEVAQNTIDSIFGFERALKDLGRREDLIAEVEGYNPYSGQGGETFLPMISIPKEYAFISLKPNKFDAKLVTDRLKNPADLPEVIERVHDRESISGLVKEPVEENVEAINTIILENTPFEELIRKLWGPLEFFKIVSEKSLENFVYTDANGKEILVKRKTDLPKGVASKVVHFQFGTAKKIYIKWKVNGKIYDNLFPRKQGTAVPEDDRWDAEPVFWTSPPAARGVADPDAVFWESGNFYESGPEERYWPKEKLSSQALELGDVIAGYRYAHPKGDKMLIFTKTAEGVPLLHNSFFLTGPIAKNEKDMLMVAIANPNSAAGGEVLEEAALSIQRAIEMLKRLFVGYKKDKANLENNMPARGSEKEEAEKEIEKLEGKIAVVTKLLDLITGK